MHPVIAASLIATVAVLMFGLSLVSRAAVECHPAYCARTDIVGCAVNHGCAHAHHKVGCVCH